MGNNTWGRHLALASLFLFLFGCSALLAQETKKQALPEMLQQLEEDFDVRFSYASADVESIAISPPEPGQSLQEILTYLEQNTNLLFRVVDTRYIAVTQTEAKPIRICAQVLDANQQPLTGATVQVVNTDKAGVTDTEGIFSIHQVPDNAIVRVRYLGYITVEYKASGIAATDPCATITLQPKIGQLQAVVLENLYSKGIQKRADGSFQMETADFSLLPGLTEPDVLQMVQALPGVTSVDETISNINIRGGTTDENLILWDGIKMYQNGHFFGLISAFNPYLTKEVDIYKNGTPAAYGESVSGIIAMRSNNKHPKQLNGGVHANMIHAGVFTEVPVNQKMSLHIAARRSLTDVYESPAYNQFFSRIFQDSEVTNLNNPTDEGTLTSEERFSFYDFSFKSSYALSDKDRVQFQFLTINNTLAFTERLRSDAQESSETSELDQRSLAGGLGWKRQWNNRFKTEALLYGTHYLLDATNLDIFSTQQIRQSNEVLETGLKFQGDFRFSENMTLHGGFQFTETGIANTQDVNLPRFRTHIKEVLRNHSIFASAKIEANQKQTTINTGLRVNYFPEFKKTRTEPRLVVHQKLGGGFALEAAGEYKSQSVTQRIDFQSDFLGVEKRRWVLANNEDVPVQEGKQASLGLLYSKNNWLLQTEAFAKKVEGITTANQGFQNQLQFIRTTGSYLVRGLEFTVNRKVKNWSTWMGYTYSKNEYTFPSLRPATFPNNKDIRHQVTLGNTYSLSDFSISAGLNWHSGNPTSIPRQDAPIAPVNGVPTIRYNTPNSTRLHDYYRIDISAAYNFALSDRFKATVNAAVLNVTNRKNTWNTYYILETETGEDPEIKRIERQALGITPNLALRVTF